MDIRVLKFETRYKNGKEEDWVLYGPAGNIKDCQTWDRVRFLTPLPDDDERQERDPAGTKAMHMKAVWSVIGPAYEAWKAGNEIPESGIPLQAWAGIDEGQVAEMKRLGIKTVEDVANITDALIQKIQLPRVRDLRKLAQEYLASKGATDMAGELAEMKEQLAAAMALLEEKAKPAKKTAKAKEAA